MIPISKELRDDLPSSLMIKLCLFKPLGVSLGTYPSSWSRFRNMCNFFFVSSLNAQHKLHFSTNQELYIVS